MYIVIVKEAKTVISFSMESSCEHPKSVPKSSHYFMGGGRENREGGKISMQAFKGGGIFSAQTFKGHIGATEI